MHTASPLDAPDGDPMPIAPSGEAWRAMSPAARRAFLLEADEIARRVRARRWAGALEVWTDRVCVEEAASVQAEAQAALEARLAAEAQTAAAEAARVAMEARLVHAEDARADAEQARAGAEQARLAAEARAAALEAQLAALEAAVRRDQ